MDHVDPAVNEASFDLFVAPPNETADDPHAFLGRRAEEFVREKGGSVSEPALIAHVFGSTGSPKLWRPLLRDLLSTSDALYERADGWWEVRGAVNLADGSHPSPEFVAIDVETTGLRPHGHRITELALIRFREGVVVERFESFCNPDRSIPQYIITLTGITNRHVEDAPRFGQIAGRVLEFVGEALLVGHNVGFDLSFLNAELKRAGHLSLLNESLDTMALAVRLIPAVRKPSLDRVAAAVGLAPRHIHRAGVDAELTGAVALRLIGQAQADGLVSLDRIKAIAASAQRRPKEDLGRGRSLLKRELLDDIPKEPGVYLLRDARGAVIYVGKAKNLRERVASYFSQPLGYTRKMDGLLEATVKIDVEVVGSELDALLLEAQLIRRYQPRYNTALRAYEHYPYIRVDTANAWPRLTLARVRRDDGARYFGPFRNKSGARKTVEVINNIVPLRTCTRSFKDHRSYGSPCIQLDLGRCLAPCMGRADREEYRGLVRDVVNFLDGQDEVLFQRLWRGLEDAADRLDFERAARLRGDLTQVQSIVGAQRQLREAVETHSLLLVLPAVQPREREILLVLEGRLWGRYRTNGPDVTRLTDWLRAAWDRRKVGSRNSIDYDGVDEANILNRFLYRNAGHPAVLPIDRAVAEIDWTEYAKRALAVEDSSLVFDVQLVREGQDIVEAVIDSDLGLTRLEASGAV
ncbi:MAG: exonuclease domain-containing protein [Chloroflexota bacterium]|nr:exonuclease domain-containing protein [Chloroflexota bacterium]